ncbi:hypothetical protein [Pengzhenrongella sp.]|uniref:hypothetical protein n=1 Tax=Pengzhenrongella sp. TaxID=2888820 RepID=UPI002F944E65
MLFEYAATLGLLDVAYADPAGAREDFRGNMATEELESLSRYDGLRAIRINALGAYVLGLSGAAPPEMTTIANSIRVLPNHDVVALGEVPLGDRLTDRGMVRLVECADPATAAFIAGDRRTRGLCQLVGDRHLAVGVEHEGAFRTTLAQLGHVLPRG